MRSFIIFALLALAICSQPQPADVLTGISTQLGLTASQTQTLTNCVITIAREGQSLGPISADIQHKDLESLIIDGQTLLENAEPTIEQGCEPLAQTLETYEATHGNGVNPKVNLEVNGPYVAQQVAILVRNVAQQNFTGIGSTVAYIYQIAIGAVDLPSLAPPNYTQADIENLRNNAIALETNQDGALEEYLQAYVDELGVSVNASALAQLALASEQVAQLVENYEVSLRNGTFDSDITALEDLVTGVLELVRANEEGLDAAAAVDGPVLTAFLHNPVQFVGTAVYNALLNAPQLEQHDEVVAQDLIAGDFAGAGTEAGSLVTTIYGQIYNN